mmetsp:Transcript_42460/g.99443  ORF Transcript_42460/g.99443 Transcript_42460/m.99443 type:complete len:256 (-) Transcript_42460:1494-2261(-)
MSSSPRASTSLSRCVPPQMVLVLPSRSTGILPGHQLKPTIWPHTQCRRCSPLRARTTCQQSMLSSAQHRFSHWHHILCRVWMTMATLLPPGVMPMPLTCLRMSSEHRCMRHVPQSCRLAIRALAWRSWSCYSRVEPSLNGLTSRGVARSMRRARMGTRHSHHCCSSAALTRIGVTLAGAPLCTSPLPRWPWNTPPRRHLMAAATMMVREASQRLCCATARTSTCATRAGSLHSKEERLPGAWRAQRHLLRCATQR